MIMSFTKSSSPQIFCCLLHGTDILHSDFDHNRAEHTQADHTGDCMVAGVHNEGEMVVDKVVEEEEEGKQLDSRPH